MGNPESGESTWSHPHESAIFDTRDAFFDTWPNAPEEPSDMEAFNENIDRWLTHWEEEAQTELSMWREVKPDSDGDEDEPQESYYYRKGTDETRWDHPRFIVQPLLETKFRLLSRLKEDEFREFLRQCHKMVEKKLKKA